MKTIKVKQKDLDTKIEEICSRSELTIIAFQRTFDIGFGAAGYVTDGAIARGLIKDAANDVQFRYQYKVLDPEGLKAYLRETLAKPIPKSQFQG